MGHQNITVDTCGYTEQAFDTLTLYGVCKVMVTNKDGPFVYNKNLSFG